MRENPWLQLQGGGVPSKGIENKLTLGVALAGMANRVISLRCETWRSGPQQEAKVGIRNRRSGPDHRSSDRPSLGTQASVS